jgi:hypothetical protein
MSVVKKMVKYLIVILFIIIPFDYVEGSDVLLKNGLKVKVITRAKLTSIRRIPDINESPIDTISRFHFLYVFEDSLSSKTGRTKNGFYKVGKTISDSDIVGWVHKDEVVEWCHRECIKFTSMKGREPAKIYDSEDTIVKALRSKDPAKYGAISEEPKEEGINNFKLRLPIIDKKIVNVNGQMKRIYNIAYLHSNDESIIREHRQLDIVFVMDTTRSMQDYIDGLKVVVAGLIADISKQGADDVQFGFVGYRDRMKNVDVNESLRIVKDDSIERYSGDAVYIYSPLTADYDLFIKKLEDVEEAKVSSGDLAEAMLDGLYTAVDVSKTKWRSGSLKVVVLVGDCSGHDKDDSVKNRHGHTIKRISNMANINKIRVIAIKIASKQKKDIAYVNEDEKHKLQMKELAKGVVKGAKGAYKCIEHSQEKGDKFKEDLKSMILEQLKLSEDREKVAKHFRLNNNTRPSDIPEAAWTTILYSLDQSAIRNKGEASFSTGWVCENQNTKRVVEPNIFVTDVELSIMLLSLHRIKVMVKDTLLGKVKGSSKNTLVGLTGETIEANESFKDFMKKKLHLPVTTKLLDFSDEELRNKSKIQLKEIFKGIDSKRVALRAFKDDQNNWKMVNDDFLIGFVPISLMP